MDFAFIHPNKNSNAFVDNWSTYALKVDIKLELSGMDSDFYTDWPDDIESVLKLLKLLPKKNTGKKCGKKAKMCFSNVVGNLIKFLKVSDIITLSTYEDNDL